MKLIKTLIYLLFGKKTSPIQSTLAIGTGFLIGLTPTFFCLQTFLAPLILVFFRISWRLFLFSLGVSYVLGALFLDGPLHELGKFFLRLDSLRSIWTYLYNLPIIPFTQFNNTVVMGATLFSLCLFPVIYLLLKTLKFKEVPQSQAKE